jgi:hypothetical protein
MNIENHMNIGQPYPDTWEQPELNQQEVNVIFEEWFDKNENEKYMFECFLESWHQAELYTFMRLGKMATEFDKWKIEQYQKDFNNETGYEVEESTVKKLLEK